jgi:hypothetical protein
VAYNLPSVKEREAYIRAEAMRLGINPDVAVRVARSEGLQEGTWQAKAKLDYGREKSFGDFQLHIPPGSRRGMGSDFKSATGLDPSDPKNWREMNTFALTQAKRGGWGPWYGAKAQGITGKMGIGNSPVVASVKYSPVVASTSDYQYGTGDEQVEEPRGILAALPVNSSPAAPFQGIMSSLGSMMQPPQQQAEAAPAPQTTATRYQPTGEDIFDYGAYGSGGNSEEDKLKKLMRMIGVQ